MMSNCKLFKVTDISIPQVEHRLDHDGHIIVIPEVIPPTNTRIAFGQNATRKRSFDFSRWYGLSIDSITYVCQRQIERFKVGQDAEIEISTLTAYCAALRYFLDYLVLRATSFGRDMTLADIDRELVDGYLGYLGDRGKTSNYCKSIYTLTKPVLQALG